MEILTDEPGGNNALSNLPMVTTEEELKQLLGGEGSEEEPAAGGKAKPTTEKKEKKVEKKAKDITIIGDPIKDDDGEEEEEEEEEEDDDDLANKKKKPEFKKPKGADADEDEEEELKPITEYPSTLHYLNAKHKLNLNLEGEKPSDEEQAEALDAVISKMTDGVNSALEQYDYIEQLLQDKEIRALLEAKQAGKGLKDLYGEFSQTTESLDNDSLAKKDFKKKYPRATDETIQGMIDNLKKTAQFDPFIKGLRDTIAEEQSSAAAEQTRLAAEKKKLDEVREQQELTEYAGYVNNLKEVYGVPMTKEMKQKVLRFTTQRDENGLTWLDHALQSNQGTVMAAIGIAYMKEMIGNSASLQGNRKNAKFIDKIFTDPGKLQGSSANRKEKEEEYDPALLNKF